MTDRPTVTLDIVVDVVCPWCYLGKRQIDAAVAALPEINFVKNYRPFQLDPTLPPEGKDRIRYMTEKFGDMSRVNPIHDRLAGMGKPLGANFNFDAIKTTPNSLDMHRLIRWAGEIGKGEAMAEALFIAFWEQGMDMTKPENLVKIATSVGMDETEVAARLASDSDRAAVQSEIAHAGKMGISGVPFTIVAGKYGISGAQPVDVLVDAFRKIAAE